MTLEKECLYCKSKFKVPNYRSSAKFCSRQCSDKSKIKDPNVSCTNCGKKYYLKKSRIDRLTGTQGCFCSQICQHEFIKKSGVYSGSKNPNFRNAQFDSDSYRIEYKNKGKSGLVHREVVLNYLNLQEIPEGFQIHHRDANRLNDDIDNLVLLTKSSHRWLHKNFGTFPLFAITHNKIPLETIILWVPKEQQQLAVDLLTLKLSDQKSGVLKLGELLEHPEEDNQQPSLDRDILEGSTTRELD